MKPCPKGKCDYMRIRNVYQSFGTDITTYPVCYSKEPMECSYLADIPNEGIEKLCRRELKKEMGIKSVVEG